MCSELKIHLFISYMFNGFRMRKKEKGEGGALHLPPPSTLLLKKQEFVSFLTIKIHNFEPDKPIGDVSIHVALHELDLQIVVKV